MKINFKRTFGALLLLGCLAFAVTRVYAALADVANKTVTVTDLGDRVQFAITFTFSATDSTNDLTSKGIYLYGLDPKGGTLQFVADGETGRDVNVFVRGAFNTTVLTNFTSFYTRPEWDDFSPDAGNLNKLYHAGEIYVDENTLKSTINDSTRIREVMDPAFLGTALVFEVDGQTGNTASTGTNSTVIYLTLKKDKGVRLPAYNASVMTFSTT